MSGYYFNFDRRNISFRTFGDKGQYRRPIFHRFEIKGGARLLDLLAENIVKNNALLARLSAPRK